MIDDEILNIIQNKCEMIMMNILIKDIDLNYQIINSIIFMNSLTFDV